MTDVLRFGEVLEAAERLNEDEQESLVDILEKRLADRRRDEVAADLRAARLEHDRGESRPATPDELMNEILS